MVKISSKPVSKFHLKKWLKDVFPIDLSFLLNPQHRPETRRQIINWFQQNNGLNKNTKFQNKLLRLEIDAEGTLHIFVDDTETLNITRGGV